MHMLVMMAACRRRLARLIGVRRRCVVVVIVIVPVVTEMADMALARVQRVANARDCSGGGIERKQDSNKKGEPNAHGAGL